MSGASPDPFAERLSRLSPDDLAQLVRGLQDRIDGLRGRLDSPIAIIGMAFRLPGASDPARLWNILSQQKVAISSVPADRWDTSALTGVPAYGGFLEGIDGFDARFFRIPPPEAAAMDPQQRLAAEVASEALETAGYALPGRRPQTTGVFLGVSTDDYKARFLTVGSNDVDPRMATGTANSLAAGRLSYLFDLTGPSMVIDTACSSSLVAAHQACRSLRAGECDMALAGGVGLLVEPELSVAFAKLGMLSPRGRCTTFGADADGYVRGEGAVIVVLKRLADAQRDADPILAVIRGSAINHDGRSNGLTAPNGSAQRAVIVAALADAGIPASGVDAVECHGTATPLGDPIEVEALSAVYGADRATPLLLGSVKANIGHLEAAAGAAGLVKAVLCLRHRTMPGQPPIGPLNPRISWTTMPLRVADASVPLGADETRPIRIGISSFGFSGTNSHLILEEAPPVPVRVSRPDQTQHLVAISARSAKTLIEMAERVADGLRDPTAAPTIADMARNLVVNRACYPFRCAVVGADGVTLGQSLVAAATDCGPPRTMPPRIAFLFTGQGSQWPGMGRALSASEPVFRRALDDCAEMFRPHLDVSLHDLLWPGGSSDAGRLDQTGYAQPALFAVQYALARLWEHWGVRPTVSLGHSIGEYAAACLAGVIDLTDAAALVATRGRLMQSLPAGGGMLAVDAPEDQVRTWLTHHRTLDLAGINASEAVVVAGDNRALDALAASLPDGTCRRLRVSHAFHSRAMDPILDQFGEAVARVHLRPARQPVISSLTGQMANEAMANPAYWVRQLRETVRFKDAVATLDTQPPNVVLEIGPRAVLLNFVNQPASARLASMREKDGTNATILRSLAAVFSAGARVDWAAFHADRGGMAGLAPATPFERERHWTDRPTTIRQAAAAPDIAAPPSADAPSQDNKPQTTRTEIQAMLAAVMQLPPEVIHPETPFVELGADSLILSQFVARIERRFGVKVPRRELFHSLNTIAALQVHLATATITTAAEAPVSKPKLMAVAPPASAAILADPHQAADGHIERLAARLGSRTAGSRHSRDTTARFLADSRGSAGYRPAIQSMLYPLVGDRAQGAHVWDVDGNDYLDITMGFGVQLFGHAAPFITDALRAQLDRGLQLGPQARLAGDAAQRICRLTCVERVAFCNTGTEAVMTALRLARAATGRQRIALFEGSYHGHFDGVLASSGGGSGTAQPLSQGTPDGFIQDVLVLDYADLDAALAILDQHRHELAAVLVEPIQSRRPGLQPLAFLKSLREWTEKTGVALIFDEVLLGFRIALGGAQAWAGVAADLVTYGKIIGGGLPIGAVAGRRVFMDRLDGGAWAPGEAGPSAPAIFFAGTFNKNPLTMAAAVAVLDHLEQAGPGLQAALNERTGLLTRRLNAVICSRTPAIRVDCAASLFRFVGAPDLFYYHLLEQGVYVWEGRTCFLSTSHTDADLDRIVDAVTASVTALTADGHLPAIARPAPQPSDDPLPLTPGQHGLWLTCQMSDDVSAAYNQSLRLTFETRPCAAALGRALDKLIDRHANLRARFQPDGQGLVVARNVRVPLARLEGEAAERALCWRPFDFEQAPLLRAGLLDRDGRHCVTLVMPHLITDGWAVAVMVDELAALYRAERTGAQAALPPPDSPSTYLDAATRVTRDPRLEERWRDQFTPPPRPLDLPTARPRPAYQTFAGSRVTRRLGSERVRRLRAFCGRQGVGLFAAGLGAFGMLLGRLGGTNDVAIGVLSAGQAAHAMPRLVGYYADLLPLRLTLDPGASVSDFLSACQQEIDDATAGRDYPFADLIRVLRLPRDPSRPPLISVAFNADRPDAAPDFGIPVTIEANVHGAVRWDLFFNMVMQDDDITLQADYATALFDASQIEAWADEYIGLLDQFVAEPNARRSTHLLAERLFQHAASCPDRVAVTDGTRALSYGDLLRHANHLAARMQQSDVRPGQIVAADLGRSAGMIVAMLAAWRVGAVFMPLEPTHPLEYREMLIAEAGAVCRVCDPAEAASRAGRLDLDLGSAPAAEAFVPIGLTSAMNAYLLFTSGSSGKPKGVLVSHGAIAAYTAAMLERTDIPADASGAQPFRFGVVSSLAADLGYTAVFGALWTGGTLRIFQQNEMRDPADFAATMAAERIDVLKIVPAHLAAMLDWPEPAAILPRQRLILGGETTHWALVDKIWRLAPDCRVFNHYGPTETTVGATCVELTPHLQKRSPDNVPLGVALRHARITITPDDGGWGEIVIGGAGVATGYLNRPDDERFAIDPDAGTGARKYRTGDRGRLLPDGLLLFGGRIDDEVKIRGHRVAPGHVAARLLDFPAVRDCVVLADPNARDEPRLVAYVVAAELLDTATLRDWVAAHLPSAMVPDRIVCVDALPRTVNGKVDRARLSESPPVAPPAQSEASSNLLRIWRDVLHTPEAGPDDDFFSLGGDSIMAIQIVGRARSLGLRFNARQLFEHPTVNRLLAVSAIPPASLPPQPAPNAAVPPAPLSPVQQAFFDMRMPRPAHWCLSAVLRLPNRPSAEAVRRGLTAVIGRHPALRLRFHQLGTAMVQHRADHAALGPIATVDQAHLDCAGRRRQEDAVAADCVAGLDLANGPLLAAAMLNRGEHEPTALLIVVHHLVFDAISWRILAEDLLAELRCVPVQSPPYPGFDAWCKALNDHADRIQDQIPLWRAISATIKPILPRMTSGRGTAVNCEQHVSREVIRLSVQQTGSLRRAISHVAGAGLHDGVLAALAFALASLSPGPLTLDIEGHGREPIDPRLDPGRMIGWFTTHFPLTLDLDDCSDERDQIEQIRRCWRQLPEAGLGYGLLRYLKSVDGLERDPEISFNFLGNLDLDSADDLCFERFGTAQERDPAAPRRHLLVVEGFIAGGSLTIELQYASDIVAADVINGISRAMTAWFTRLANVDGTSRPKQNLPESLQFSDGELQLLAERLGL